MHDIMRASMELQRGMDERRWRAEDQAATVAAAARRQLDQADDAITDILAELEYFETQLDPAEEARLVVIGGPTGTAIFLEGITARGHDRILFTGLDSEGCKVAVMQHVSQLNLMTKAVKVGAEKARRIGFHSPDESRDD